MDLVCICLHFKSWVCWRQEGLQLSNKYAKNMGKNEEKHKYFSANFDTARKSEFGSLIRHCSLYRIEKKRLVFSRLFEVVLFLQKFSFSFCKKKFEKKNLYGTSKTRNLRWSVTITIIPELAMTCTSGCCWSLFFWLAPGWGLFCLRWRLFCVGETELDFLLRWWWCGFSWWW